jgi:hypothetical protein
MPRSNLVQLRLAVLVARLRLFMALALLPVAAAGTSYAAGDWPATGSISGRVTAADTGAPIAGVLLRLRSEDSTSLWGGPTDAAGNYSIAGLANGRWTLEFDPPDGSLYFPESYNNRTEGAQPDRVIVAFGAAVSGIDAALERGGIVSGRVTGFDTGLSGIEGWVRIYNSSNLVVVAQPVDRGGNYRVAPLPAGRYRAEFSASSRAYAPSFSGGGATLAEATPFDVTAGGTSTVDAVLPRSAVIRGTVTAEDTGAPLAGLQVTIYDTVGSTVMILTTGSDGVFSSANGNRGIGAGVYRLAFGTESATPYLGEFYNNRASLATADGVSVTTGQTLSVDVSLARTGSISGRVTAASSGAALAGVSVWVATPEGRAYASAETDASGVYRTTQPLPAGNYTVCFAANGYHSQCYNDRPYTSGGPRDLVPLAVGQNVTGIDAVLRPAGTIRGRVTAADTGEPVAGAQVRLYPAENVVGGYHSLTTAADGTYTTLVALQSRDYVVEVRPPVGLYASEFYRDSNSPAAASRITLTDGVTVTADVTLDRGGVLAGRVTGADTGAGLADVFVTISGLDTQFAERVRSDGDGSYTTVRPLPAGRYIVRFEPLLSEYRSNGEFGGGYVTGRSAAYLAEYSNDVRDVDDAAPVIVTSGATTTANAALARGGSISGRVSTTAGAPAANAIVDVYDEAGELMAVGYSDSTGAYGTPALPAGAYRLHYRPNVGMGIYSGDVTTLAAAQPITVRSGADTSGVNATLPVGSGSISGRVYAAESGMWLRFATVRALDVSGLQTAQASVGENGTFQITGLPSGSYRLRVETAQTPTPVSSFIGTYYGGATLETAKPVNVQSPGETSGIEFALGRAGVLSGQLRGDGRMLNDVSVRVYDAAGQVMADTKSWGDGRYSFVLPSGVYRVQFDTVGASGGASGYASAFYGGATTLAAATPILVTAPNTVTLQLTTLVRGGTITGRVRSAGVPISSVWVRAYDAAGRVVSSTQSAQPNGEYVLPVPAGSYRIGFNTDLAQDQYPAPLFASYGGTYYGGATLDAASVLSVAPGATISGIDAALGAAGFIAGQIANDVGPSQGRVVEFYDSSGRLVATAVARDGGATWVGTTPGTYTSPPLAPGTYRVRFSDALFGGSERVKPQPEFFRSAASLGRAQAVTVVAGQMTLGVDATLFRMSQVANPSIAGVVTAEEDGAPLGDVVVEALDKGGAVVARATSGADGRYLLRGITTRVRIRFTPSATGSAAAYIPEHYNNRPGASGAEQVGPGASGVDAALTRGAQFAGAVTSGDLLAQKSSVAAAGLPNVAVTVYDAAGSAVATALTDAQGSYVTAPGLPPGSYRLGFTPPQGSNYAPTFFPAKATLGEAAVLRVTGPGMIAPDAGLTGRQVFLPLTGR